MRLACLLLFSLSALVQAGEDDWYRETRELYSGIPVTVRFTPADPALAEKAWAVLDSVDAVFNDWKDGSEIGRINAGGVATHQLSPWLAEAFDLSGRMREATGGACEITLGSLRRLWRGAERSGDWPGEDAIAAARAATGPGCYRYAAGRLEVLRPGVKFDFGGVCKGMAVDRTGGLLRAAGRTAGLVQVGGETCVWGTAPSGRPHRLGIPHPDSPDDGSRTWCRLQDPGQGMCGSTSGNYRNPVVIGGKVCYHIYDPRTGMPTDTHVLSVSVVFPGNGRNGMADALTKAGIVLGPPGLALIEQAGAQAMMLVRSGGTIEAHTTSGWNAFLAPAEAAP